MIKKIFFKFMAIFLCVLTLFNIFAMDASAATCGGSRASTVYVTTKANWWVPGASSITLRQDKQTLTYKNLTSDKTKTKTGYYGCYDITIFNVTKNKITRVFWGGGQTKKISLDPNCTYRITVSYNATLTSITTRPPLWYSWKSTSSPWWKVKSTWKVSSYS